MMRIAHFWNWDLKAQYAWGDAMRAFADCGHRELLIDEWMALRMALEPGFAAGIKKIADASGVSFTGAHAPWGMWDLLVDEPGLEKVKPYVHTKLIKLLPEIFGIRHYVMHMMTWRGGYEGLFDDALERTERELEPLLAAASGNSMVICLENGFSVVDNPESILRLMRRFAGDHVGCCLDVGHLNIVAKRNRFSFDRYLEALLPYIVVCHLHDNDGKEDRHWLPGDGIVDWKRLMPILRSAPRLQSLQNEAVSAGMTISERCRRIDVINAL